MNSDGCKKLNSIDRAQLPHISNGKGQVLFNKHFASQTKVQHHGIISVRLEQEELHINSRDDVRYTGSHYDNSVHNYSTWMYATDTGQNEEAKQQEE